LIDQCRELVLTHNWQIAAIGLMEQKFLCGAGMALRKLNDFYLTPFEFVASVQFKKKSATFKN
jgi:hypothetical protein